MGGDLIFKSYFYSGTSLISTLDKVIASGTVLSSTGWINISNRITTPINTTSMKVEIHNGMFNGWIAYDDPYEGMPYPETSRQQHQPAARPWL